jgi:RimJ/RimL family protein N-acetyltransferase
MANHEANPRTTGEIVLRDVEEDDLLIFFEQQLDPEAIYMAAFTHKDPADRDAFAAHWARIMADDKITNKTILVDGRVAGSVASYVEAEFGKPEVTYWLGKDYWGKGVATRALSEFVRQVETRPLYGRAARDNVASIRVLEKCGFTLIGYDKGFANARGAEIEEAIFELK